MVASHKMGEGSGAEVASVFLDVPISLSPTGAPGDPPLIDVCLFQRTSLVVDFRTLQSAQSNAVNSVGFKALRITI